jgi:hypothetical protein
MQRPSSLRLIAVAGTAAVFFCVTLLADSSGAAAKKGQPSKPAYKPLAPPPRSSLLTVEDWQRAPLTSLTDGEIDALVSEELRTNKIEPAPLTTDEQFLRRVTLDLTGELPLPADVTDFASDPDPQKRRKLIDKLLDTDDYAQHWADYWRDVFASRLTDRRGFGLARNFEQWLFEQVKGNKGWDNIAREMIVAQGPIRYDQPATNGAAFFLAAHRGADSANERAAETSRVFLGIQIQCAQCHDHPMDQWKRVQFHELAAFYARLGERPVRDGQKVVGLELVGLARGEHEMPNKDDPKKSFLTNPRFLDGKTPGPNRADAERRRALADYVVNKNNYWFAGAYVNRVWGALMGQSFYEPVDDMGPKKEVVYPRVLTRLTGSFRASNYDMKGLFRDLLNSASYQRQIRLTESNDQHLHFAAAYPTRLRADALWQSIVSVLGQLGGSDARLMPLRRGGPQGLEIVFKDEFDYDPSLKPDEVEGSIGQALMMMNNPAFNERIQARGSNLLGRILRSYPDDDQALRMLYLRTLARAPTDAELRQCRDYIVKAGKRADGFEDVLWALLNSTEFQTKR